MFTRTCTVDLEIFVWLFFHVRNVRVYNFRRVAKWQKLNVRVRNIRAFNFHHLSNCQNIFLMAKISRYMVHLHVCILVYMYRYLYALVHSLVGGDNVAICLH